MFKLVIKKTFPLNYEFPNYGNAVFNAMLGTFQDLEQQNIGSRPVFANTETLAVSTREMYHNDKTLLENYVNALLNGKINDSEVPILKQKIDRENHFGVSTECTITEVTP